ncbi:hypothetical protein ACGF12_32540 [Kitasatospora sp. NPDC048296]|uniref:hypothetical protein n=1 Tax=Kitasatospora sp. NPDC048296 TaxID=3364048 RepID=UPI0037211EA9
MAVTPDSLQVYVANAGSNNVSVISTATNTVTTTVGVGTTPLGVAIIPPAPTPKPSLTITKSHTGNFTAGRVGVYTITVGNNGTAPTDGTTVTMKDTLPAGLTAASITGRGWSCVRSTLTCTRSDVLNPGNTYPPITLRVRASRTATGTLTNTAMVSGGGDGTATATATATDPTIIDPCDDHHHW